jgi:hypothetical protein
LLLSRLAAKNKVKHETARIQSRGEKRFSRKPPATAAMPVALELLIPRRAKTRLGHPSPAAYNSQKPADSRPTSTSIFAIQSVFPNPLSALYPQPSNNLNRIPIAHRVRRKRQRLRSTDFIASPATGLDLRRAPARRDLR